MHIPYSTHIVIFFGSSQLFVCYKQCSRKKIDGNLACFHCQQPHILEHPKDQSVASGAVAEFQVKATGDGLQFQWQKNRKEILCDGGRYCDTDTDTLRIEEVEGSDKGRYRCIVTARNDAGKMFSDDARLTISKYIKVAGITGGILYYVPTDLFRQHSLLLHGAKSDKL